MIHSLKSCSPTNPKLLRIVTNEVSEPLTNATCTKASQHRRSNGANSFATGEKNEFSKKFLKPEKINESPTFGRKMDEDVKNGRKYENKS
jgi:hypothetical protein